MKEFLNFICTFKDKLLNLCNSSFKVLFKALGMDFSKVGLIFKLSVKERFLLQVYKEEEEKGFQIFIIVRRGEEYGKKVSDEL